MLLTLNTGTTGQSPIMTWVVMILLFLGMIIVMRRFGNKRVAQMEEQREQMKSEMVPGTWVRTTSGFFGKIVEISGEVVTLENITGDETLWDVRAIAEVKEPNFGNAFETSSEETQSSPEKTGQTSSESAVASDETSINGKVSEETYGSNLDEPEDKNPEETKL